MQGEYDINFLKKHLNNSEELSPAEILFILVDEPKLDAKLVEGLLGKYAENPLVYWTMASYIVRNIHKINKNSSLKIISLILNCGEGYYAYNKIETKNDALEALKTIGTNRAYKTIAKALEGDVGSWAASLLSRNKLSTEIIPILKKLAKNESSIVRHNVSDALEGFSSKKVRNEIFKILEDTEKRIIEKNKKCHEKHKDKEDSIIYHKDEFDDDLIEEIGSVDFNTGIDRADEFGYYSLIAYRPLDGSPIINEVIAFGYISFIGRGGAGTDEKWYCHKDKSINIEGALYESDDNDENEKVESVFHKKIHTLLKKERFI